VLPLVYVLVPELPTNEPKGIMNPMAGKVSRVLPLILAGGFHPLAAQMPGVAIERRVAQDLDLSIGDTVRLGPRADSLGSPVIIAAIYEPRPDPAEVAKGERHIRMHLPHLAGLLGSPDRVDRISIGLRQGISADSSAAILNKSAYGYRAYESTVIASESSQTFRVVSRFHRAIAVITIVASAVFLLCIMLLKVEERRMDAAVMRFVGVRRRTIFGALLLEAVLVAVTGALVGTGLAYLAGTATNVYYREFFDTDLTFSLITPGIVLFSAVLSIMLGAAAGAAAAWRLVNTRPLVLWGRG
jgi:putative ABC transport system permease protein